MDKDLVLVLSLMQTGGRLFILLSLEEWPIRCVCVCVWVCVCACMHVCIHDACVCAYSDLSSPPQDGQLQKEDQLLQINEESVLHMEYDDIIAKLQTVSQAGQPIRLVIARAVSVESQSGEIPDLNDVRYCWGGGGGGGMQYVR